MKIMPACAPLMDVAQVLYLIHPPFYLNKWQKLLLVSSQKVEAGMGRSSRRNSWQVIKAPGSSLPAEAQPKQRTGFEVIKSSALSPKNQDLLSGQGTKQHKAYKHISIGKKLLGELLARGKASFYLSPFFLNTLRNSGQKKFQLSGRA